MKGNPKDTTAAVYLKFKFFRCVYGIKIEEEN